MSLAALVGWLVPACSAKCSGVYNCPDIATYDTFAPAGLNSPLVEVSADLPCHASLEPVGDAGSAVTVDGGLPIKPVTCHVHGTLSDGTRVEATVTFRLNDDCCGTFTATESGFTVNDAGT